MSIFTPTLFRLSCLFWGALHSNFLANDIKRLNSGILCWCLGEKIGVKKKVYIFFKYNKKCFHMDTVGLAGLIVLMNSLIFQLFMVCLLWLLNKPWVGWPWKSMPLAFWYPPSALFSIAGWGWVVSWLLVRLNYAFPFGKCRSVSVWLYINLFIAFFGVHFQAFIW